MKWTEIERVMMILNNILSVFADFVKNNAAAVSRKNSTTSRKSSVNNKPNTASSKKITITTRLLMGQASLLQKCFCLHSVISAQKWVEGGA